MQELENFKHFFLLFLFDLFNIFPVGIKLFPGRLSILFLPVGEARNSGA